MSEDARFPEEYFRRYDERDDESFYGAPRLTVHLDDAALARTTRLYREYLPSGGAILDLMSSWRSHLPDDVPFARVAGLGMNAVELRENPQLTDYAVRNLNRDPTLPYDDASFDGAVLTVSVQYLTRPLEVFAEVGRVLRPAAPFITVFSNRMFPTKAVMIWQSLDDAGHAQLVGAYYRLSGCFDGVEAFDISPAAGGDPLFAVIGRRSKG